MNTVCRGFQLHKQTHTHTYSLIPTHSLTLTLTLSHSHSLTPLTHMQQITCQLLDRMNVAGIHPDGKFLRQVMEIARDLTDRKLLLTGVEYAHQIERYGVV